MNDVKKFEEVYDLSVLANIYLVVRLDGRCFSSLTEKRGYQKPFDDIFNKTMCNIVEYIMRDSGFNILYGYTQSDEISFLFDKDTDCFNRRVNKLTSVLASLAASVFTSCTNEIVSFDARISYLPTLENVLDYFKWRQHDASRNALNGYCYWELRKKHTQKYAVDFLNGKSSAQQQEILFQQGINYNNVVGWHKQGIGFYWKKEKKSGVNPTTNEKIIGERNKLHKDVTLSHGKDYEILLHKILTGVKI
jgi:tRNA(His) 5'-end guanylyltransferase